MDADAERIHLGLGTIPRDLVARLTLFDDPRREWRRIFSEFMGTFFLVLVAAGGGMMAAAFDGAIGRTAAVVAPGLMVMAMIMFMARCPAPTSTPR